MMLAKRYLLGILKAIRTAKGLTQVCLSELADLSPSIVSNIKTGRCNPTLIITEKIAFAFETAQSINFP